MAQLDITEFKTQTAALFPTNGAGAISAADLRTQMDNAADSFSFIATAQTAPPTVNDDNADTAGNGIFQPGHIWVDETNDAAYICLDASTGAAVWTEITVLQTAPDLVQISSSRSLSLLDANDIIEVDTSGGAVVLTIPDNASVAFPISTIIDVTLINTDNTCSITADAGVTLNGVVAGSGDITATAWSGVRLYKRATDEWVVQGDIGTVS